MFLKLLEGVEMMFVSRSALVSFSSWAPQYAEWFMVSKYWHNMTHNSLKILFHCDRSILYWNFIFISNIQLWIPLFHDWCYSSFFYKDINISSLPAIINVVAWYWCFYIRKIICLSLNHRWSWPMRHGGIFRL